MNKIESAVNCFKEGFSCSQSVLSAFAPEMGLDRVSALKVAGAFGGGIGRMGGICGAVSGAFMAIGLKYGKTEAGDDAKRDKGYELVKEFTARFKTLHGSITCRELLGCDLSTSAGTVFAGENNLFELKCRSYVADAVQIAEELLGPKEDLEKINHEP